MKLFAGAIVRWVLPRLRLRVASRLAVMFTALLATVWAGEFRLQLRPRTVYIVHMANGLDAHLASRFTSSRVIWVVLDPAKADAILTDRIDDAFWAWSSALNRTDPKNPRLPPESEPRPPRSPGNRGTIFLVDPRAALVLWSTYQPANKTSPSALDHMADHVANSLKKKLSTK